MKTYSRRDVAKLALLSIPAIKLSSALNPVFAAAAAAPGSSPTPAAPVKVNSKVNGVQIGLNVPYSFGNNNLSADETLANCIKLGVSGIELRSQPVEGFLGIPPELAAARGGGGGRGGAAAA